MTFRDAELAAREKIASLEETITTLRADLDDRGEPAQLASRVHHLESALANGARHHAGVHAKDEAEIRRLRHEIAHRDDTIAELRRMLATPREPPLRPETEGHRLRIRQLETALVEARREAAAAVPRLGGSDGAATAIAVGMGGLGVVLLFGVALAVVAHVVMLLMA